MFGNSKVERLIFIVCVFIIYIDCVKWCFCLQMYYQYFVVCVYNIGYEIVLFLTNGLLYQYQCDI